MLLNLSNHPSSNWSDKQLKIAKAQFGTIKDMVFPIIDPSWSSKEVKGFAKKFLESILTKRPEAVHIMGEMTFTFFLVQKLQQAGIRCVASTSDRKVEERKGKKIVHFDFVQFRDYV